LIDARASAGLGIVAVVGLIGAGVVIWAARPSVVPPVVTSIGTPIEPVQVSSDPSPTDAAPSSSPSLSFGSSTASSVPSGSGTSVVVVDVEGKVHDPGVVTLPLGSRVVDAIKAAGGLRRGASTAGLNLAQVLTDGQLLSVDVRGPVPTAASGVGAPSSATSSQPIDLNTATFEQLDTLPGIGPVLAQRILDWRGQNGGFTSIDELREVSGIGDATYADIAPLVRV
jgi:competence protein ComEA